MSISSRNYFSVRLFVVFLLLSAKTKAQDFTYEIAPWYNWKKSATVLTFDDWSPDHPVIAVPEMSRRGIRGTFFVNGWALDFLGKDIQTASDLGHEIGNHTQNHVNLLETAPDAQVEQVTQFQQRLNDALPNDRCETFCYPFGAGSGDDLLSLLAQSTVSQTHIGARAVINRVWDYNFGGQDYYRLPALIIDSTSTPQKIRDWNQLAIEKNGLAVIMYHKIDGGEGSLTISTANFLAQLDALLEFEEDIWIATFRDMIKYHREANSASLQLLSQNADSWELILSDQLNDQTYNHPLSLRVKAPNNFEVAHVIQGNRPLEFRLEDGNVYFDAIPDSGNIILSSKAIEGVRKTQTISFNPIDDKKTLDEPFEIDASSTSGLPVSFVLESGPAVVNGNRVILTGSAGTVRISATQRGSLDYNAAQDIVRVFEVVKVNQSITFENIADKRVIDPPFRLKANADSELPISYKILSGPATLSGDTLKLTGNSGTVTIEATQPGNDAFRPALPVKQSFNVNLVSQTLTLSPIPNQSVEDSIVILDAVTSSGLPVSFEVTEGPATISGNTCFLQGKGGIVTVSASQPGNEVYESAPQQSVSFEVLRLSQEIQFESVTDKRIFDAPFSIKANASSGLPITLSVVEGPANLTVDTVVLSQAAGKVILEAQQEGNDRYNPAPAKRISFLVNKETQSITFDPISDQLLAKDSVKLSANSSSGLPVTFQLVNGPGFIQNDSIVYFTGFSGEIVVRATQAGSNIYEPASPIDQSFRVDKVIAVNTRNFIDAKQAGILIYPNPATQQVDLRWGADLSIYQLVVVDFQGRVIRHVTDLQGHDQTRLMLDSIPRGIYALRMTDAKNRIYHALLAVQ